MINNFKFSNSPFFANYAAAAPRSHARLTQALETIFCTKFGRPSFKELCVGTLVEVLDDGVWCCCLVEDGIFIGGGLTELDGTTLTGAAGACLTCCWVGWFGLLTLTLRLECIIKNGGLFK